MHLAHETVRIPYRLGRFAIAGDATEHATTVLVSLRSEDPEGPVGVGEAIPSARVTGLDVTGITARLEACARSLQDVHLGPDRPPPAVPAEAGEAGPVACAIDGALLDLWAQTRNEPLWRALGLTRATRPTTATVSLAPPREMALQAETLVAAGFTHLKVKLGEAVETDRKRLGAVRAAAPQATLRVDGNEGWRLDQALAVVPELAAAEVDVLEQPLARAAPTADHHALNRALETHAIAHVLDEAVHTAADVERIARGGTGHGVNLKLQKAGGLRPGLAVVEAAERHGLRVMLGCFVETWAGIALAAQLAGRATWVDLDGAWLLAREPVRPLAPILQGGRITAGDAPGIGVRLAGGDEGRRAAEGE